MLVIPPGQVVSEPLAAFAWAALCSAWAPSAAFPFKDHCFPACQIYLLRSQLRLLLCIAACLQIKLMQLISHAAVAMLKPLLLMLHSTTAIVASLISCITLDWGQAALPTGRHSWRYNLGKHMRATTVIACCSFMHHKAVGIMRHLVPAVLRI